MAAKKKAKKPSLLTRAKRWSLFLALLAGGYGAWIYFKPSRTAADILAEVGAQHTPEGWLSVISQGFEYDLGSVVLLDDRGLLIPACQAMPSSAVAPTRKEERVNAEHLLEANSSVALAEFIKSAAGSTALAGALDQAFRSSEKIRVKVDSIVTENYSLQQLTQLQGLMPSSCAQAIQGAGNNQPAYWALGVRWFKGVEISCSTIAARQFLCRAAPILAPTARFNSGAKGAFRSALRSQSRLPHAVEVRDAFRASAQRNADGRRQRHDY
jgi:hypothetical protein